MAVTTTRTPGQIWVSNTPPNKDHIITLLNDMIAAIDAIDPQLAGLLSSLETRRVASTANSNFANTTFPTGTTTVLFTQPAGFAIWRSLSVAPSPVGAIHQQDATGAWWERVFQLSDLRNALRNAGLFSLTGVGGTPNAITASFADPALALGITVDANTVVEVIPVAANTSGATLQVTGDIARTMQTERGLALPAGFLRSGVSMLFRRAGANWRALPSVTYDQIIDEQVARTAAIAAAISAEATARDEAIDAGDLRVMAEDRTVVFVGAPREAIDANGAATAANAINWVFPTAAVEAGDAGRFRAQIAVAGLIRFGVYRDVGDNLYRVRSRDIFVPEGYVDIPINLHLDPGDRLGAFMGAARVRFLSGGGTGYYFNTSSADQSLIVKSSLNTTNLLIAQFVVYQGTSPVVSDRDALVDNVDDLSGRVESLEYDGRDIVPFGMTDDARLADPAATPAASWNFVLDSLRPAGNVIRAEFYARNPGTVRLGVFFRSGSTFTRRAFVDLVATVGYNRHDIDLEIRAGEYVGYRPSTNIVPFQSNSVLGTETAIWFNNNSNDLGTFTGTLNTTQQHLLKITQAVGEAAGDAAGGAAQLPIPGISKILHSQTGNSVEVTATTTNAAGSETTATAAFTIPATATTFRYDLIVYDHGTNTLSRLAGTERNDAANVQAPVTGAGQQAVLRIRAGTGGITSIAAIPEPAGAVPRVSRPLIDQALVAAKAAVPKLMTKIATRQPLRFMGYGDSVTALTNGSTSQTQANGTGRDRITGPYLTTSGIYDAASIASIPLFTSEQLGRAPNGLGAVHTRIGINWQGVVDPLERRGWVLGTDLWYDNFARPGTSTQDMWDDVADAPTAWLASIPTAAGAVPDVVIFATAMNERGYAVGREARFTKILNWIRGQGIEVIITGCARAAQVVNETRWTNQMLARVARVTGCAFIPLEAIWEDAVIGALGLNVEDICHANRGVSANHPGTIELRAYGRVLAELFS